MMTNDNSWRLIFDAGGTNIRFGLVNEKCIIEPSSLMSAKTAKSISTREEFCDLIIDTIKRFGNRQEIFVISIAGPISSDNLVIRKYTNVLKDDMDIPISEMVKTRLKKDLGKEIEVFVLKDATAASLAEMGPFGAASDRTEVLSLILGTGTGGAICKKDKNGSFTFPEYFSDLGHHQVDIINSEVCNCGGKACVELQTSGTAVIRNINRLATDMDSYSSSMLFSEKSIKPGSIAGEDIAWAAAKNDLFTLNALRHAARSLAALLRNVFTSHPEVTVVFTGGFALGVGEPLLTLVKECLKDNGVPFVSRRSLDSFAETRILLGKIPSDHTNLLGARMFLQQMERIARNVIRRHN